MGAMNLSSQIEIAASPETVRATLLARLNRGNWNQGMTIDLLGKTAAELRPGDKVKMYMGGPSFHATIMENTPEALAWGSNLRGVFGGTHQFVFAPSQTTPGGTTLINREEFTGLVTTIVKPFLGSHGEGAGYVAFNQSLKKEVEEA